MDKNVIYGFIDNLYTDIGEKIKHLAKWTFIIGAFASVLGAIVMMATAEDTWALIVGLLMIPVGPIVAWVSSWLLYGFGELIDTLDVVAYNTYHEDE